MIIIYPSQYQFYSTQFLLAISYNQFQMQENQAPMIDEAQPLPLPPQPAKDPSPFFYKILITLILIIAAASIINPETRRALSNLHHDIYFRGQVWRLLTPSLVTFSAIDCVFVIICGYMSIATFEKKVGSIVFIVDFIMIGLLMNFICSLLMLAGSYFIDNTPEQLEMRHCSGFFGMYFFYLSRFYFLNPENDVPFFCFIIKQKNFPQVLFLVLMAVTSFNVPLIISVSYLMVTIQQHFFKGRYFKFNFYFYLKLEKLLKWIYNRDDFYSMTECQNSLSFLNNLDDLRRLYMQEQRLVLQQIREFMGRLNNPRNEEAAAPQQNNQENAQQNQQNDVVLREDIELQQNRVQTNHLEEKNDSENTLSLFNDLDSVQQLKTKKNEDEFYV